MYDLAIGINTTYSCNKCENLLLTYFSCFGGCGQLSLMASRLGVTGNSHRIYTQSANAISVMLTIVLLVSLRIESIFASYQYTYNTSITLSSISVLTLSIGFKSSHKRSSSVLKCCITM